MPKNVDPREVVVLARAIHDAYPNPRKFDDQLRGLGDTLGNYSGMYTDYPDDIKKVVVAYNAKWNIDRLTQSMLAEAPDNGKLAEFAWRHGIAYQPPGADAQVASGSGGLEKMLDPDRGFGDVGTLLRRLGAIANAICHITVPISGAAYHGTGFLVGDGTVLTNWHVVEEVSAANRRDVTLQFDYRTGADGATLLADTTHRLLDHDTDWLIDSSPYHGGDLAAEPLAARLASTRPDHHLDYAALRVAGRPGAELVRGAPRGFLALPAGPEAPADFDAGSAALFVMQHPFDPDTQKVLPLQYDWEKPALYGKNADGTRVLYKVNTRFGSSGSPCFNAKFDLVALHHAGGKDWPAAAPYLYNQGMPIARIVTLLKERDKLKEIK